MKNAMSKVLLVTILMILSVSCKRHAIGEYPITPVPFKDVVVEDILWRGRIQKNLEVSMPYVIAKVADIGGFNLSEISKVLEGISYYLMVERNAKLETLADSLITVIESKQDEDGFVGRNGHNDDGTVPPDSIRWLGVDDFGETGGSMHLYGFGHMYEAAVAYYEATGKTSLLNVAEKNARLLLSVYGKDKLVSYPFHPEIELALVKLFRATGNIEYFDLSKFYLDSRGPAGTEYSQSHQKIVDQIEATGHAVRALYLYSGITDIAAITKDTNYKKAIDKIWKSVVGSKIYITGGIGAKPDNEGFGKPYELPNSIAYNETCASIANIFWSYRMFLLNGDASYIDVLERTLYNSLLSGTSISGDRFFYPNPLESNAQYQRASWYGVPCCPTNVIRFMPQIPGYVYASRGDDLYLNLYISSKSVVELASGKVEIRQETDYPWHGTVRINVTPSDISEFTLRIRIPGWAKGEVIPSDLYNIINKPKDDVEIKINDKSLNFRIEKGYAVIQRNWKEGDIVELNFPMDICRIKANDKVMDDHGRFAIQRGPLVYCLEGPDNNRGHVSNLMIPENAIFETKSGEKLSKGTLALTTTGKAYKEDIKNDKAVSTDQEVTAIPYYLWANRGPAEMVVWIPSEESAVTPLPEMRQTLALRSRIISSYDTTTLSGINDQFIIPFNQNIPISNYYRWPMEDTIQWVQYLFNKPETVSSTRVYWYDNEPSKMTTWYNNVPWTCCRVPVSWELFYLDNNKTWQPVEAINNYGTERYMYNEVKFKPVITKSVRMIVKRHQTCASGLQEWVIN